MTHTLAILAALFTVTGFVLATVGLRQARRFHIDFSLKAQPGYHIPEESAESAGRVTRQMVERAVRLSSLPNPWLRAALVAQIIAALSAVATAIRL